MMILNYATKKELKQCIGRRLKYKETSLHGEEYRTTGKFVGSNRPWHPDGTGTREFYAEVTMKDGLIEKVK
jgi:hypothetical protein